jgi:hypothetical protein
MVGSILARGKREFRQLAPPPSSDRTISNCGISNEESTAALA